MTYFLLCKQQLRLFNLKDYLHFFLKTTKRDLECAVRQNMFDLVLIGRININRTFHQQLINKTSKRALRCVAGKLYIVSSLRIYRSLIALSLQGPCQLSQYRLTLP